MVCNARSLRYHGYVNLFSLELWLTNNRRVGHRANRYSPSVIGVATKLREEAINGDDGDRTVRVSQEALGNEPDEVAH